MIVATAGHVDHGKSTLVRLLTGTDPDRWEEEKRRGLTIDLGFACLRRDDIELGFVDVPGHQRFLANMLAGCGSVDVALLVVSAREGWMPQTEEHSQILDLLGVTRAVVALTFADTVAADDVGRRTDEVAERLAGTSLAGAPVVATARDRPASIDQLAEALVSAAAGSMSPPGEPSRPIDDRPRLWIDRSFTVAGSGRVVTGTLAGGTIHVGDDVDLVHGEGATAARVRSLQVFGRAAQLAPPATRVGVALAGIKEAPGRGWALARREEWTGGRRWRVAITPVRAVDGRLAPRGGYQVFVGTVRASAQLRYGGDDIVSADAPATPEGLVTARLHLVEPIAPLSIGDRFILRDEGSDATVGGGSILAVDDERVDHRPAELHDRWRAVEAGRKSGFVAAALASVLVEQGGGAMAIDKLQRQIGVVPADVPATWGPDRLDRRGDHVVRTDLLVQRRAEVEERVASGATELPGDPLGAIAAEELAAAGTVEIRGSTVTPSGTRSHGAELETALVALRAAVDGADVPMCTHEELRRATGIGSRPQKDLVRAGALVAVGDFVTTSEHFDRLKSVVAEALADGPQPVSTVRAALGLTRRVVIPLLETLDGLGLTRREGDQRAWTGGPASAPRRL